MRVIYIDGTEVQLGDEVLFRWWFARRKSRVVYLPGVSPKHPKLEYQGLGHVGIRLQNGVFLALLIDPESPKLTKRTQFVRRSTAPFQGVDPNEPLFE